MLRSIVLVLSFVAGGFVANAADYLDCNKWHLESASIESDDPTKCAVKKNNRYELLKFKDAIASHLVKKDDEWNKASNRYNNNYSRYLLTINLTDPKTQKSFPVYFNKKGIGHRAYFFDNGADYFNGGLARIEQNGKIGFLDKKGNIVIAPKYSFASPFYNGYARFCQECRYRKEGEHTSIEADHWQFVDRQGNEYETKPKTLSLPFVLEPTKFRAKELASKEKLQENTAASRAELQRLCAKGNESACLNHSVFLFDLLFSFGLGEYELDSREIARSKMVESSGKEYSEKDTLRVLAKNCAMYVKTCSVLGMAHAFLGQDQESAAVLDDACKKGESYSCFYNGFINEIKNKKSSAKKYYSQACALGTEHACFNLGRLKG